MMTEQENRRRRRIAPSLGLMVLLASGPAHLSASADDEGQARNRSSGDTCQKVAQDVRKSCENGARDEYWLAKARCKNTAPDGGAASKNPCGAAASDELAAQRSECRDQFVARKDICSQLGGGPYAPNIDPGNFVAVIDNPYLPLVPGTTFRYESVTAQGQKTGETGVVEVTGETRSILGVPCVVVRDTATVDGQVVEDTIDWYAQDKAGNVWYFGEESKQYANGFLVAIDGSWRAGVDGALPGIVMEAVPAVGDVYRQEFAVGEAEDVAKVLALGQAVSVPFGGYTNALQTGDFSAFEPDLIEQKFYVPGVGFVLAIDPETGGREELVGVMAK